MNGKLRGTCAAIAAAAMLGGCAGVDDTQRRTATGAALGGAAAGIISGEWGWAAGGAALGAVGFTGDPVGQTVQQAVQSGAGIVADEIDDRIAGNPHPSTAARERTGIAQPQQEPELSPEERKARFDAAFG